MGGDGKGKGKGGAPKAAPKAGPKKTPEELKAEAAARKAEREAAQAKQRDEEKAHMDWLGSLTTLEASNINAMDWSAVEKQVLLSGGTSILKMADGKVGSLRRVGSPAMEIVAASLAEVVGLPIGAYKVVHPGSEEYAKIEDMTAKATAFLDDMPMVYEEFIRQLKEANADMIPTEQKLPLIEAYEYSEPTRGTALLDLSAKSKGTIFVMEFPKGKLMSELCGKPSKEVMQSLGRLGLLGALINAEDMMPLPIWRESGGMKHCLKLDGKEDSSAVRAINLRIAPLEGAALVEYTNRLKMMASMLEGGTIDKLVGYPDFTPDSIVTMVVELLTKTGFDADASMMRDFFDGLNAAVKAVATSFSSGEFAKAMDAADAKAKEDQPWKPADALTAKACKDFVMETASVFAGDAAAKGGWCGGVVRR